MHYLLDTDIASFAIRGTYGLDGRTLERFAGQLQVSWPTETELLVWAYLHPFPFRRLQVLRKFARDVPTLPLTPEIQNRYAHLKAKLQRTGISISEFDLLIASTALTHKLVLVTHNTNHFRSIPGLRLQDWAKPDA
jgi:predicted nucleic acid-binding protein